MQIEKHKTDTKQEASLGKRKKRDKSAKQSDSETTGIQAKVGLEKSKGNTAKSREEKL